MDSNLSIRGLLMYWFSNHDMVDGILNTINENMVVSYYGIRLTGEECRGDKNNIDIRHMTDDMVCIIIRARKNLKIHIEICRYTARSYIGVFYSKGKSRMLSLWMEADHSRSWVDHDRNPVYLSEDIDTLLISLGVTDPKIHVEYTMRIVDIEWKI